MRKTVIFVMSLLLVFSLAVCACADTAASKISVFATVGADGVCQINAQVTLRLEQSNAELSFPVPANADHVTLNGSRCRTRSNGSVQNIDLSKVLGGMAGEFTFTVAYNVSGVVQTEEETGIPQVVLPILSGFSYPVELLEFSVTMPGEVTAKPAFSSGYHQASIEQDLTTAFSGNTVNGQSLKTLKDHETLTMTLDVDPAMFPNAPVILEDSLVDDIAMAVCGILALLYWIMTLRAAPVRSEKTPLPPAGYSAGELSSVLTLQGTQLSMMVFTWAQLGYVLIQLDRNKRVLLHKRMDMGNERSGFEQRCFQNLFGDKRVVDTSGYRYAMLCQKTSLMTGGVKHLIRKGSGNPRIFRCLCAGIGAFGGMALGIALGAGSLLQWFWVVVLAALGAVSAWYIQAWAECLLLLDKQKLWVALALCGGWILLGLTAGLPLVAFLVPLAQLLAGLMAAFGGRRTDAGKQAMSQVLGLRRYLKSVDKGSLYRITEQDPEYFHTMAPYALALGVDKLFARQFGRGGIPPCPYLTTGMDGHRSAAEWSNLMRRTNALMEQRLKQLPRERLERIIASFRR